MFGPAYGKSASSFGQADISDRFPVVIHKVEVRAQGSSFDPRTARGRRGWPRCGRLDTSDIGWESFDIGFVDPVWSIFCMVQRPDSGLVQSG